ncbi:telomere-associated protein RIF1 isoform X2 [Bacillus rossius redtenbacheri]|uniref:telomere-associated protein RIF1 isoform X2 n=1 Tax=Bacillus rossius redtenbacheri TaxID=93214 RepID=UPI002FDCE88B
MTSLDIGRIASILQDGEATEEDKFSQLKELKSLLSGRGDALMDDTTARYLCRSLLDCSDGHSSPGLAGQAVLLLGEALRASCPGWGAPARAEVLGSCAERVAGIVEAWRGEPGRLHAAHDLLQGLAGLEGGQVSGYFASAEGHPRLRALAAGCAGLAGDDDVVASLKAAALRLVLAALRGGPAFADRLRRDADFWTQLLFPSLFSLKSWRVRSVAVEIFRVLVSHDVRFELTAGWENLKEDIKNKYVPVMLDLVGPREWYDLWCLVIDVVGNDLLDSRGTQDVASVKLFNSLLAVPERAFKSADPANRLLAFDSWKWLVRKFSSKGSDFVKRKLKLLNQPLAVRNDKTSAIYRKKIEVWWCVIQSLGKDVPSCLDTVVAPLLKFCFGIVGGRPFLDSSAPALTPEKTPGKKDGYLSHWKLDEANHPTLVFVLSELLAVDPSSTRVDCEDTPNNLSRLSVPVLDDPRDFLRISRLLVFSVGECVLLVARAREPGRTVGPLWHGLLRHMGAALACPTAPDGQDAAAEAVKDVQRVLRGLADQAGTVPGLAALLLGPLLEGALALPASVLAGHAFDAGSSDLMGGTPALFLVELLLSPSLLAALGTDLLHGALMTSVLRTSVGEGLPGSAQFAQAVARRLDAAVLGGGLAGTHALALWRALAERLTGFAAAGGDAGDDPACLHAVLLFPLSHHHHVTSADQVDELTDVWGRLYGALARQVYQRSSAEGAQLGEFVSGRICGILRKASPTALQLVVLACSLRDVVDGFPHSILGQALSRVRSTPLAKTKAEKPLANISGMLQAVSKLVSCLRSAEPCSRAAALAAHSVATLFKLGCPGNAEPLFLQLAPLAFALLELPPGTPDLTRQSRGLWAACAEFVLANQTFLALPRVSDSLVALMSAALKNHDRHIKKDALSFSFQTVQDIFRSRSTAVPVPLVKAIEICSNDDDLLPEDVGEDSQTNVKPVKLAGSFLARMGGGDGHLPQNVQELPKSPVKTHKDKTPVKKVAEVTVLKGSPSNPLSLKKRPLTARQREMMKKRRDDIPALYEDLTQDTQEGQFLDSQDSMSLDTVPAQVANHAPSHESLATVVSPNKSAPNTSPVKVGCDEGRNVKTSSPSLLGTRQDSGIAERKSSKSRENILHFFKPDTNLCKDPMNKDLAECNGIDTEPIMESVGAESKVTQGYSVIAEEKSKKKGKGKVKKGSIDEGKTAPDSTKSEVVQPVVTPAMETECAIAKSSLETRVMQPSTADDAAALNVTTPTNVKPLGDDSTTHGSLLHSCRSSTENIKSILSNSVRGGNNDTKLHEAVATELTKLLSVISRHSSSPTAEVSTKKVVVEKVPTEQIPGDLLTSSQSTAPSIVVSEENVFVEKEPSQLPDGLLSLSPHLPTEQVPDAVLNSTVRCAGKSRGRRKSSLPKRNNPYGINFKNCMYVSKPLSPGKKLRSRKISVTSPKGLKEKKPSKKNENERNANQLFVKFVESIGSGNEIIDQRSVCNGIINGISHVPVPVSVGATSAETISGDDSHKRDALCKSDIRKKVMDDTISNEARETCDDECDKDLGEDFSALTNAFVLELSMSAEKNKSKADPEMGSGDPKTDSSVAKVSAGSHEELTVQSTLSCEDSKKVDLNAVGSRRSNRISKGKHSGRQLFLLGKLPSSPKAKANSENKLTKLSESQLGVTDNSEIKSSSEGRETQLNPTDALPGPTYKVTSKKQSSNSKETCSTRPLQEDVIGVSFSEAVNPSHEVVGEKPHHTVSIEGIQDDLPKNETKSDKGRTNNQFCTEPVNTNKNPAVISGNSLKGKRVGRKRKLSTLLDASQEIPENLVKLCSSKLPCDESVEDIATFKISISLSGIEPQVRASTDKPVSPELPVGSQDKKRKKLSSCRYSGKTNAALPESCSLREGDNFYGNKNCDETPTNTGECLASKKGKVASSTSDDAVSKCGSAKKKTKSLPTVAKSRKITKKTESERVAIMQEANEISSGTEQSTNRKEKKECNSCSDDESIASLKVTLHGQGKSNLILGRKEASSELPVRVDSSAEVIEGSKLKKNIGETGMEAIQRKSSLKNNKSSLVEILQIQSPTKKGIDNHTNISKTMVHLFGNKNKPNSPVKSQTLFTTECLHERTPNKTGQSEIDKDLNHKNGLTRDENFSQDLVESSQDVGLQDITKYLNLKRCSVSLNGLAVVNNKIIDQENKAVIALASNTSFKLSPTYNQNVSPVTLEIGKVSPVCKKINFDIDTCSSVDKVNRSCDEVEGVNHSPCEEENDLSAEFNDPSAKEVNGISAEEVNGISDKEVNGVSDKEENGLSDEVNSVAAKEVNGLSDEEKGSSSEKVNCSSVEVNLSPDKTVNNSNLFSFKGVNCSPKFQATDNSLSTKFQNGCPLQKILKDSKKKKISLKNTSYSVMKSKTKDLKCVGSESKGGNESPEGSAKDGARGILDEGTVTPTKPASRSTRMLNSVQSLLRGSCVSLGSQGGAARREGLPPAGPDLKVKLPIGKLNDSVSIFVTRNVAATDDAGGEQASSGSPAKSTPFPTRGSPSGRLPSQLPLLKSRTAHILNMSRAERSAGEEPAHQSKPLSPDDGSSSASHAHLEEGVIAHSPDGKLCVRTWKRHTYSPVAVPASSSLKRMREGSDGTSPPPKKKSVSFSDPPRSLTLVFSRVKEEVEMEELKNLRTRNRVSMYSGLGGLAVTDDMLPCLGNGEVLPTQQYSEESSSLDTQGSLKIEMDRLIAEPNKSPFYDPLKNCNEPIEQIAVHLVPKLWAWKLYEFFETGNIKTVGDLASLPTWVVEEGHGSFMDAGFVRKALRDYELKLGKSTTSLEKIAHPLADCSPQTEGMESAKQVLDATRLSGSDAALSGSVSSSVDGGLPALPDSSEDASVIKTSDDCGPVSSDSRGRSALSEAGGQVCEPMDTGADGSACNPAESGGGAMECDMTSSATGGFSCDSATSNADGSSVCDLGLPDCGASVVSRPDTTSGTVASDAGGSLCDPVSDAGGSTIVGTALPNNGGPAVSDRDGPTSSDVGTAMPVSDNTDPLVTVGLASSDHDGAISPDSRDCAASNSLDVAPGGGEVSPACSRSASALPESASPVLSPCDDLNPSATDEKKNSSDAFSETAELNSSCDNEIVLSLTPETSPASTKSRWARPESPGPLERALEALRSVPRELLRRRAGDVLVAVGEVLSSLGRELNLR